MLYDKVTVNY